MQRVNWPGVSWHGLTGAPAGLRDAGEDVAGRDELGVADVDLGGHGTLALGGRQRVGDGQPPLAQRLLQEPQAREVALEPDPPRDAELVGEARLHRTAVEHPLVVLDAGERPGAARDVGDVPLAGYGRHGRGGVVAGGAEDGTRPRPPRCARRARAATSRPADPARRRPGARARRSRPARAARRPSRPSGRSASPSSRRSCARRRARRPAGTSTGRASAARSSLRAAAACGWSRRAGTPW